MTPQRARSAAPILECVDVTRTYDGSVQAIRGVSAAIWPGEFVAVVGPSGSGKTTLLQLLGTLDRPTSGQVLVNGTDVTALGDRALSRLRGQTIGFVFQQFHLSNLMSVRDNVAEGLIYARVPHRERRERASDICTQLGLGDRLGHRPNALSGGEKQRVAIARAVIGNPGVILADEPTGNLDTANGMAVMDLLRDLAAEGTAVVVITHDRDLATFADRSLTVRDGLLETPAPTASVAEDQGS